MSRAHIEGCLGTNQLSQLGISFCVSLLSVDAVPVGRCRLRASPPSHGRLRRPGARALRVARAVFRHIFWLFQQCTRHSLSLVPWGFASSHRGSKAVCPQASGAVPNPSGDARGRVRGLRDPACMRDPHRVLSCMTGDQAKLIPPCRANGRTLGLIASSAPDFLT